MGPRSTRVRMLLTSAGMANGSIRTAFADLVARPLEETSVVVVLTASLAIPGDKRWVVNELARLDELRLRQIDLLDLAVPSPNVEARLREADVVYVLGGDVYHLARTILDKDLGELLEELLAEKVYVFGLFDWYVACHWHSDFLPERDDETSGGGPVVDVVSEGRWRLLGG